MSFIACDLWICSGYFGDGVSPFNVPMCQRPKLMAKTGLQQDGGWNALQSPDEWFCKRVMDTIPRLCRFQRQNQGSSKQPRSRVPGHLRPTRFPPSGYHKTSWVLPQFPLHSLPSRGYEPTSPLYRSMVTKVYCSPWIPWMSPRNHMVTCDPFKWFFGFFHVSNFSEIFSLVRPFAVGCIIELCLDTHWAMLFGFRANE